MKHAYKCGAIPRVLVLRRRFAAFPEARLQLALKRKALARQWNDADDDDYSRLVRIAQTGLRVSALQQQ
jgi:hypothetical protein